MQTRTLLHNGFVCSRQAIFRKLPWLAASLTLSLSAQIDLLDVLRRCQEADDGNAVIERNYVFEQRTETRTLDGQGKVKSREIETFDTILSGGRPYQRLIGKNDQPLSAAEEKKEQAREQKEAAERARETPVQREKALAAEDARRRKNRDLVHEALKAFTFKVVAEDADTWTLEATPRAGYRPVNRETALLKNFRGRIWLSKRDYIWTKFDGEAIANISIGFGLARLEKGAHIVIERTHINDEVWLPRRIEGGGAARIALVKKLRVEFETTCSRFRRFSADSRLVSDPVK